MDITCPSCKAPIDPDATSLNDEGTTQFSLCGNCGFRLSVRDLEGVDEQTRNPASSLNSRQNDATGNPAADEEPGPTFTPAREEQDATVITGLPHEQSETVAHFELIRVLGQGGFGAVWLARDTHLNREVALKLPRNPDNRLLHEAQTAARLRHPNIVAVFEVGVENGRAFIASEYIEGESLKAELHRGRPPQERAVSVMIQIALAAEHAHAHQVVHRDMKPANVMVNRQGTPYITDFGIAKSIAADETISLDGEIVGTIAYMAPEQASGRNTTTDHRADIYAMGVMLFELLTEYRPFRGSSQGILFQKSHQDAPSPRTLLPSLAKDLETICLKCLERDPEKRYQSAQELADELKRFQDNIPISARPVSRVEKAWRWCLRNPAVATSSTMFVTLLITACIVVSYFWRQAEDSNRRTSRTLYRARMTVAANAWTSSDIEQVSDLLQIYETSEYSHLKDFAWYYFDRVRRPFGMSVNHGTVIVDLAISRDGKLLATLGTKGDMVRVWDMSDGRLVRELDTADHPSRMICFSPADDRLLTADSDGLVRVWSPLDHDHVAFELDHGSPVACARFSPNRRLIVSGGDDGTLKFWNVGGRELVREFVDGSNPVVDFRFSADSSRMAMIVAQGVKPSQKSQTYLRVLDVETAETVVESEVRRHMSRLAFSADSNEVVATTESGFLHRFDAVTGREIEVIRTGVSAAIGDVVRIGNSGSLAVSTSLGNLKIMNSLLQPMNELFTHLNSFGVLDASADGRVVVVGSGDGTARLIDMAEVSIPQIGWQDGVIRDVLFCDGDQQVAAACSDGAIRLWNIRKGLFSTLVPADEGKRPMLCVDVNPQSGAVGGCGMMRQIQFADPGHREAIKVVPVRPGGHDLLKWAPKGVLMVLGHRDGQVGLYNGAADSKPLLSFGTDGRVSDAAFSASGKHLACAFENNVLLLVDTENLTAEELELPENDPPLTVAFCADDRWLVVGTQQGFLRFVELANPENQIAQKAHAGRVNDLAIFPDGAMMVSAGQDKMLRIWDIETREAVTQLAGHERGILAVTISSDGRTLASCSVDGELRLWMSD